MRGNHFLLPQHWLVCFPHTVNSGNLLIALVVLKHHLRMYTALQQNPPSPRPQVAMLELTLLILCNAAIETLHWKSSIHIFLSQHHQNKKPFYFWIHIKIPTDIKVRLIHWLKAKFAQGHEIWQKTSQIWTYWRTGILHAKLHWYPFNKG